MALSPPLSHLGHKVGAVEACPRRIDPRQLALVVVDELDRALLQQGGRLLLVERRHLVVAGLF